MSEAMIPETDQWKLEADCKKCRRQPYCGKPCTQSTRLAKKHLAELWEKALEEHLAKQANPDVIETETEEKNEEN